MSDLKKTKKKKKGDDTWVSSASDALGNEGPGYYKNDLEEDVDNYLSK